MLPVDRDTWDTVPGYDSDSGDDEGKKEKKARKDSYRAQVEERIARLLEALEGRHEDPPRLDFDAVPLPRGKNQEVEFCPVKRRPGFSGPPPTFRMEHICAPIVKATMTANGLTNALDSDWSIMWSGPGMKPAGYAALHEFQRINHFPGSTELTRKDSMYHHLAKMAKTFGNDSFDFIPETYVLPQQAEEFVAHARRESTTDRLWIVKPSNAACGRGIYVFRKLELANLPLHEPSVVSRYVENPLLIQGLKFDLRIYVLVTQYEPLRAYIYREGLARFASKPYSTEEQHLRDAYRHLTNYSINKNAPNFQENQKASVDNQGHKWSLSALNNHLKVMGADVKLMWSRMMDLITKTLLAVEPSIAARTRKCCENPGVCFEIYGFDILVDEELKPWIIEVNLSPSMKAESPLDWHVKSALLADSFNLIGAAHPTYRIVSEARMKAHLAAARAAQKALVKERGSFTGLKEVKEKPPSTKAWGAGGLDKWAKVDPEKPVDLEKLTAEQLKVALRSLQELKYCHNFIPLYPTKRAVERYLPITQKHSKRGMAWAQLLSHLVFGPKLPKLSPVLPLPLPQGVQSSPPPKPKAPKRPTSAGPFSPGSSDGSRPGSDGSRRGGTPPEKEKPPRLRPDSEPHGPGLGLGGTQRLGAEAERRSRPPAGAKSAERPPERPTPARNSKGRPPRPLSRQLSLSRPSPSPVDEGPKIEQKEEEEEEEEEEAEKAESYAEDETDDGEVDDDSESDASSEIAETEQLQDHTQDLLLAKASLAAIDAKDSSRLVLMAYLVRVSKACQKLSFRERVELAQSGAFARLSIFSRRVKAMKKSFASTAGSRAGTPEEPSDSDEETRGLVDEIIAVCRGSLSTFARDPWPMEALQDDLPRHEQPRWVRELVKHLPARFVHSERGKRALDALQVFSCAELEQLLQSPGYVAHIGMLPELFASGRRKSLLYDGHQDVVVESLSRAQTPSGNAAPYVPQYSPIMEILRARSPRLTKVASTPSLPSLGHRSTARRRTVARDQREPDTAYGPYGGFHAPLPQRSQRWQQVLPAKTYAKPSPAPGRYSVGARAPM